MTKKCFKVENFITLIKKNLNRGYYEGFQAYVKVDLIVFSFKTSFLKFIC